MVQGPGHGDDTVFAALAVVDGDGGLAEIEILDAEFHGFHEAEAATVHDLCDEFPRGVEMGEEGMDFLLRQDDGRARPASGGDEALEGESGDAEDVFVEEGERVEGLFLGSGGDDAFEGEGVEEGGDGGWTGGLGGLAEVLVAEVEEARGPVGVGFLGGRGEGLEADFAAERVDDAAEVLPGWGVGVGVVGVGGGVDGNGLAEEGAVVGRQGDRKSVV